jgi:hypothetical protein
LGAAVQAVAAAVSSVRSTVNVVENAGFKLKVSGAARGTAMCRLDELEDAMGVYFRDAPTKTPSVNSAQTTLLIIVMLQTD